VDSVYPIIVGATALCYGVVGAVVRLLVGNSLEGLIVAAAAGSFLYAILLWRWRGALRLHDLAAALRPSAQRA
jgi:membrane protein implicated in regulation of membrane protease activity